MWLLNMFGGGSKHQKKKKKSKKGKKVEKKIDPALLNPVKDVKIFGYSKIGYGPKKTECQDSLCIMENFHPGCYHFFAVYDGHGSSGKEASQAANDFIQTYIEKNLKRVSNIQNERQAQVFLKAAFKNAESRLKSSGIDYSNSGTCAIAVMVLRDHCYIANLGDSRAVLFRQGKEKQAIELSWDHKPTRPDEKHRIQKAGGKIEKLIHEGQPVGPYRVWQDDEGPGIAMTRTLGDLQAKKIGLISEPEIEHFVLRDKDEFIVIGSDGIWDVMSSAEVVGFVLHCLENVETREKIAEALVMEARSRWDELNKNKNKHAGLGIGDVPYLRHGCDDITAVVALFSYFTEEEMEEKLRMPQSNITKDGQRAMNAQSTGKDSQSKYQVNVQNSSMNKSGIHHGGRDTGRDGGLHVSKPQASPNNHSMNKSMNNGNADNGGLNSSTAGPTGNAALGGLAKTMMASVKQ